MALPVQQGIGKVGQRLGASSRMLKPSLYELARTAVSRL